MPSLEEFVGERLDEPVKIKALKKREEEIEKDKGRIDELAKKLGDADKEEKKPEAEAVYGV